MDATQVLDDFDEEEANNSGAKKTVCLASLLPYNKTKHMDIPTSLYKGV